MGKEKPTKTEKALPIIFGVIITIFIIVVFLPNDEQRKKIITSKTETDHVGEWVLEKDIDLNTGDTIYRVSLFTEQAPALSFYRETNMKFCIDRTNDKYEVSLVLGKGHFLPNKKVDLYFLSMKPDISYEYDLLDNGRCAQLKVGNTKALIKKIQIGTGFFLHAHIDKQTSETPFGFVYNQESASIIK
jgi:5-hydroxyisourate hydrolase-like protein (transthyretin family)|nr:MAG TPA: hypothetical protein [Caudoviricetes sp.]